MSIKGGDAMRLSVLAFILWTTAAQAAVPAFIPYSGRLSDGTAWQESTTLNLTLTLYDAQADGQVVFRGQHADTQVVDGYFTVNLGMCDDLGACDPNPANARFPTQLPSMLWLGVAVGDKAELPRVPVGSVPYASRAGSAANADSLGRDPATTMPLLSTSGANVGIGTIDPSAKLEIDGDLKVTGSISSGAATCTLQFFQCPSEYPHSVGSLRFRAGNNLADAGSYFRVSANGTEVSTHTARYVRGAGDTCSGAYCGGDVTIYLCCR